MWIGQAQSPPSPDPLDYIKLQQSLLGVRGMWLPNKPPGSDHCHSWHMLTCSWVHACTHVFHHGWFLREIPGKVRKRLWTCVNSSFVWSCSVSCRACCFQGGMRLSPLLGFHLAVAVREKNPLWGWGERTILEGAALTYNLRLSLFPIWYGLDFWNRTAHVLFCD